MTIEINQWAFGISFLPWTTLFTIAGTCGTVIWMIYRSPAFGLTRRTTYSIGLHVVLWAILGGRLFHVIDYAGFYVEVPLQVLYLWNGGLSLWGALIIGLASALWYAKQALAKLSVFSEALTLGGLVTLILGRFGDFLGGERLGTSSSLPWAVDYANERFGSLAAGGTHPIALYEILLTGTLLILLIFLRGRVAPSRTIGIVFAGYASGRFGVDFFAAESTLKGLTFSQWVALVILVMMGLWRLGVYARSRTSDSQVGVEASRS